MKCVIWDFDALFYVCCYKVRMSERDFWKSSMKKVLYILESFGEGLGVSGEPGEITSMKEIPGWI